MIPPTPFMPTKVHIPADQSLLLATEPIWEDDSFDMGTGADFGGGADDTFWAGSGSVPLPKPASAAPTASTTTYRKVPTASSAPLTMSLSQEDSDVTGQPGPGPSTQRNTSSRQINQNAARVQAHGSEVMPQMAYTGMTGGRSRRPFQPAEDVQQAQGAGKVDRAELADGGYRKRSRADSPVEHLPTKKARPPTPKKDDFYSRRVKDSDRRSSLGPKSPMLPQMEISHGLASSVSDRRLSLSRSIRSSAASTPSSTRSDLATTLGNPARPSTLSSSSSRIDLPHTIAIRSLSPSHETHAAESSRTGIAGDKDASDSAPRPRLEAKKTPILTGQSALSRYLAKTSRTPTPSLADEVSAQPSSIKRGPSDTPSVQTPPPEPTMSSDLRAENEKQHRSVLSLAGEAVRGFGGALRRSLSRSSLGVGNSVSASPVVSASPARPDQMVESESPASSTAPQSSRHQNLDAVEVDTAERTVPSPPGSFPSASATPDRQAPVSPIQADEGDDEDNEHEVTPSLTDSSVSTEEHMSSLTDSIYPHIPSGPLPPTRRQASKVPAKPAGAGAGAGPKLPAPLTRPGRPFGTTTATRALQPRSHPSNVPSDARTSNPSSHVSKSGNDPLKRTTLGAPSSLAARALARLPKPAQTSAAALERHRIALKDSDRANGLKEKRERYEALARGLEGEKRARLEAVVPPRPVRLSVRASAEISKGKEQTQMTRTIPIRGNTPGKASRARAEARGRYDQELKERQDERERREREVKEAREEMEREEERVRRLETVVVAHALPAMYSRRT